MAFETTACNGIFDIVGAGNLVNASLSSIGAAMVNGVAVCVEMMQESDMNVRVISPRLAWIRIAKVCGPLGGLAQNEFVNLAVACGLLGLSAMAVFGAVGPVALLLAAIGLFCDAIAYGAAQAGVDIKLDQSTEAQRIGNQRRVAMILEDYQKHHDIPRPGQNYK